MNTSGIQPHVKNSELAQEETMRLKAIKGVEQSVNFYFFPDPTLTIVSRTYNIQKNNSGFLC